MRLYYFKYSALIIKYIITKQETSRNMSVEGVGMGRESVCGKGFEISK